MVYLYRHHIGLSKSLYNKIFDDVKLMSELFSFLSSVMECIFVVQCSHGQFVNHNIFSQNTGLQMEFYSQYAAKCTLIL